MDTDVQRYLDELVDGRDRGLVIAAAATPSEPWLPAHPGGVVRDESRLRDGQLDHLEQLAGAPGGSVALIYRRRQCRRRAQRWTRLQAQHELGERGAKSIMGGQFGGEFVMAAA